jgi:dipeptidyl aminopeptidase/acylaminoacyl peptidase
MPRATWIVNLLLVGLLGSDALADQAATPNRHELRHEHGVGTVAYSSDGKLLATGCTDGTIWLWEAATGRRLHQVGKHPDEVWTVAFSPDGKTLVSGGRADLILRVWDVATGKDLPPFLGHRGGIVRLIFSKDGQTLYLAGGSWDPTIRVWDVTTRRELKALPGHTDYIDDLALSPDGKRLASASRDATLRLWDLATGRELQRFGIPSGGNTCIAFSPDGRLVASSGHDATIRIWEVATRIERTALTGHESTVQSLAFAKDGRTLISGGQDSTVRLWDIYTGKQRRPPTRAHQGAVRRVTFTPDGNTLASASEDGYLRTWDLSSWVKDRPLELLTHRKEVLDQHWQALAAEDGFRAHQAVYALASARRQAVPLIKERVKPVPVPEARKVSQLIAELDSPQFKTRENASEALAQLDDAATPALQRAFAGTPSPEVRRRLTQLLNRLDPIIDPDRMRTLRCIEILELAGTVEAQQVLETLTRGSPEARETREAKAALEGLTRRLSGK